MPAENNLEMPSKNPPAKPTRRTTKARQSILEKLTPEELQSLRLDEASRAEFETCVQRFNHSRADLQIFEGEDTASMSGARYDQFAAAEAGLNSSGMAVVRILAPRILRLRDSAAKRKWRSFLTKFRKEEKLA